MWCLHLLPLIFAAFDHDPIASTLSTSAIKLPLETHRDSECGGKPTLGALVRSVIDEHPTWRVQTHCSPGQDSAPYQCIMEVGKRRPEGSDPMGKRPTGFTVVYFSPNKNGRGVDAKATLECFWLY